MSAGQIRDASAYAVTTAMPMIRPRSSTTQPSGARRAAPIAAANTAR